MAFTLSTNMSLPVPGVGTEAGPQYAIDINDCMTLIDRHDHTAGSGVAITPMAIDINTDLTFASNSATNVKSVVFAAQPSITTGATAFVKGVDLYYNDADGNEIQITANGGVNGTPGSITGLVSPASASYISGSSTFVWQSDTNIAANMDAGSLLMRNITPNSTYALTLQPPAALASNYALTLPIIPAANSFMVLSNTGVMAGSIPVALGIDTANIATGAVTAAKLATDSVTTIKILNANVTPAKLSFSPQLATTVVSFTSSGSQVMPAGATTCTVIAWGGGGGGAGGAANAGGAAGGGGGASGSYVCETLAVVPGETVNVVIGAGGGGGAATVAGTVGSNTQVDSTVTGWILTAPGGGAGISGGAGGDQGQGAGYTYGVGGNAGAPAAAGGAGKRSSHAAAVAGMNPVAPHGGGGAGSSGRLIAGTQVAGNNGTAGSANSAAGGGGGAGGIGGQAGGAGGSGHVTLIFNSTP